MRDLADLSTRPGARVIAAVAAVATVGLTISGGWMMFTDTPDPQWTSAANGSGAFPASVGLAGALEDLHSTCAVVLGLILVLMTLVLLWQAEGLPRGLVVLAALLVVASVSGLLVQFKAVEIAGRFSSDVRGYWFVFDGDLGEVIFGGRRLGPTAYRLWALLHALAGPGAVVICGWLVTRAFWRRSI